MAPLFSKIWTHLNFGPNSFISSIHLLCTKGSQIVIIITKGIISNFVEREIIRKMKFQRIIFYNLKFIEGNCIYQLYKKKSFVLHQTC